MIRSGKCGIVFIEARHTFGCYLKDTGIIIRYIKAAKGKDVA